MSYESAEVRNANREQSRTVVLGTRKDVMQNLNSRDPQLGLNNVLTHFRFLGCYWQFWVHELGKIYPMK